jgi:hypothetical protein
MDALLTTIVLWLSLNFNLPVSYEHPRIEFASKAQIAELYERGSLTSGGSHAGDRPATGGSSVVAVYSAPERTIYLPEGWTGRTPTESSMLVHEMVHHLQTISGQRYACPQEREKLAYAAQEKWLNLMGRTLESELQLDRFTLLVLTQCLY